MDGSGSMFHGPLHFGTSSVGFDVIYDTGSDWVVVEGKNCTNCQGDVYNSTASSIQSKQVGTSISSRTYGNFLLYGTEFLDRVCINYLKGCVENFQYFQITANQTGLSEPFDGILGMARNKPFLLGNSTNAVGPLFVDALANAKVISDNRFSFSLGYVNGSTFVDFGVPQTSAMSNQNDIRDIYVEKDFFWSAYSQAMAFNTTSMDSSYGYVNGSLVYSIFDTGASGIMLSSDYFQTIVT